MSDMTLLRIGIAVAMKDGGDILKLGKAGIGSLSFVVLWCSRGRRLRFRINR